MSSDTAASNPVYCQLHHKESAKMITYLSVQHEVQSCCLEVCPDLVPQFSQLSAVAV